jgi:hypothetical protein
VTGDETWVHCCDPENKKTVSGVQPQRITSAKKIQSQSLCWKSHVDCILEFESVVLIDFLEKGATVNSKCCTETLKILNKWLTRKGTETDDVLLQQDSARPHTSAATTDAIACLGFRV